MSEKYTAFSVLGMLLFLVLYSPAYSQTVDQDRLTQKILSQKVNEFDETQQLDSLIFYLQKLAPYQENKQAWEDLLYTYLDLGYAQYRTRAFEASSVALRKSLAIGQKHLPNDFEAQTNILHLLGAAYEASGDFEKGLESALASLEIRKKQGADKGVDFAKSLNNIAVIYYRRGDYDKALEYYERALVLYQQAEQVDLISIAKCYSNMSLAWRFKDQNALALEYARKQLAIYQQLPEAISPANLLNCYNNLALALQSNQQADSALYYLEKALAIESTKPLAGIKKIQFNLGFVHLQNGAYSEAETWLQKALSAYQKKYPNGHPNIGKAYLYLGNLAHQQKNQSQALQFYQAALMVLVPDFKSENSAANPSLNSYILSRRNLLKTLFSKAKVLGETSQSSKDQEVVFQTYSLAVDLIDQLRSDYKSEASKYFLATEVDPVFQAAIQHFFQLHLDQKVDKYLDYAFYFMEKSKTPLLLEALNIETAQTVGGVPKAQIQQAKQLAVALSFYEGKLHKAQEKKDTSKVRIFSAYLFEKRENLLQLKQALKEEYPRYFNTQYQNHGSTIAEIQAALDPQSLLLEFTPLGDSLGLIAISAKQVQAFKLAALPQAADWVNTFKQSLQQPVNQQLSNQEAFQQYTQSAWTIYQRLLWPVLQQKTASFRELIIVPNSFLFDLPFEALLSAPISDLRPDYSGLPYLVYDYNISYSPSATLFKKLAHTRNLTANPKVLAISPFSGKAKVQPATTLPPLLYADQEIAILKDQFSADVLEGSAAKEASFVKMAGQYDLLHFTTHGKVNLERPAYSHLSFSASDSLLYAYEIQNLDLKAALVVLSACETGRGKIDPGEGGLSLARGFFYAGVPKVLMTLWPINDQSSSTLIPQFYAALKEGKSSTKALQQAKVHYLNQVADAHSAHPYFWAAYVGFGHFGGAERMGFGWWFYLGLGVMVVFVFLSIFKTTSAKTTRND